MSKAQSIKSNSVIDRLVNAYNVQPDKYQRKGYGKIVGYLLLISYFTILPDILTYIWPTVLQNVPRKLVMIVTLQSVHIIILVTYNLAMYLIYTYKIPFFQKYRINSRLWPWEVNSQEWRAHLKKTLKTVALNVFVFAPVLIFIDSYFTNYSLQVSQIPATFTHVWQFCFFILIQDFFFYIGHRTFHHPKLYWIHKQHHEYNTTVTLAAQYAHPIQSILGNSVPVGLGYRILVVFCPVHLITMLIWFTFRIVQTCDGHSGYQWSWAQSTLLPFSAGSGYHNFHHTHNVGNYGSFFKFWDSIFGTNTDYIKFKAKQYENQKKN